MDIDKIAGHVFRDSDGKEYGRIRALSGSVPVELQASSFSAFAEDECGNFFVEQAGSVGLWDHETSRVTSLASSMSAFLAGISPPTKATLRPWQVKRAWLSPEFAASLGKAHPKNEP